MAQYKKIEVVLTVKRSPLYTNWFKSVTETYTDIVTAESLKSVQDGLLVDVMATCVDLTNQKRYDGKTGQAYKVTYAVKAHIAGSASATGVSKENGAKAIERGIKRGKSRSAKKRAAAKRAAAKKRAA